MEFSSSLKGRCTQNVCYETANQTVSIAQRCPSCRNFIVKEWIVLCYESMEHFLWTVYPGRGHAWKDCGVTRLTTFLYHIMHTVLLAEHFKCWTSDTCSYNILLLSQGFPGYHTGYMNPPDQRRTPGAGQYYAEYATINNQGGRSGPNRPPDIPQVTPAMQEYADYSGKQLCRSCSFVKNS